jgi:hypothetical protein
MERSLCSAVNKLFFVIPRTLFNWIFRYHNHNSPSIFPFLSQINQIRSLSTFLYKIISILSCQLHLGLSNFLFLSDFATKSTYIYIFIYLFSPTHLLHTTPSSSAFTWPSKQCLERSRSHEAAHCEIFPIHLLLPFRSKHFLQ